MTRTSAVTWLIIAFSFVGVVRADEKFHVLVQREKVMDGLVTGTLFVNGERLGPCYENEAKKIPAGTYRGVLRTRSTKNFVQGPRGVLGNTGDFLLEAAAVPGRSDILFHAGNKPNHSEGCILCGPAGKDPKTGMPLAPETLRKLRLRFFGEDQPLATPNRAIVVEVREP